MRSGLLVTSTLFLLSISASGADNFSLRNGDRVVFYGDSITDQRLYTVITETYVVTRFPNLDVSFVHSGWGGDKVSGGGGGPVDLRLQRDVIAYKPDVMTVMLGMNDGLYQPESAPIDQAFFNGYQHIVDTVKAALPGIRITAIEPSPFDDVTRPPKFPGGYNAVLLGFSKWLVNYASQNGLQVADLNTPVVAMLRQADTLNPAEAQKILPDRVHPGFSGHLIMAEQLLKCWNATPLVSSVTIDAASSTPKVQDAQRAALSELSQAAVLSWTELDQALPLPFAAWQQNSGNGPMALVLKSSDVTDALNQEPLRVTGLKAGSYLLKIDGQKVGSFNSDELTHGVNLALLDTPMSKQAKQVYDLTVLRCDTHNSRWRTIDVPLSQYNWPSVPPALSDADALDAAVAKVRHDAAKPRPHKFELAPAA